MANQIAEERIGRIWHGPNQDIRERVGGRPVGIAEIDGHPCIVACSEQGGTPVAVDLRDLIALVFKRWPEELFDAPARMVGL